MYSSNNIGLTKGNIRQIIKSELERNADLLIGIDDPEVNLLVNVLVESFSNAIAQNNKKIRDDLKKIIG